MQQVYSLTKGTMQRVNNATSEECVERNVTFVMNQKTKSLMAN